MTAANYLLLALGLLGATDILLYHSISHGIRSHADSRVELFIHALRGPTYALLFFFVPNFEMHGAYAVALAGLLAIDVGVSVADFAVEGESRRGLGGLPTGEYVLHMILAMVFGAFVACLAPELWNWSALPTGLARSGGPAWLSAVMGVMSAGVLISGIADLVAALRIRAKLGHV